MKWTSSSMTLMLDVHLKSYRALYFGVRLLLLWWILGWEIRQAGGGAAAGRRHEDTGWDGRQVKVQVQVPGRY